MGMNDINSLSHTKWNCKYHIVFAPKYRRKVFYREKREAIGKILRQLCEWKGVKIIEAEACPDHIHLFVEIPPKMAVSTFMGYLKGKSSTMLYEQFGELKYKFRNREFWCRGYYVDTVGKNESRIAEYIKNQLNEDALGDQLRIPGTNPFTCRIDGITYSAYGEGAKPIITSSPENGAGAEKWQLVYEGENGTRIWQFYHDLTDIASIVFDDDSVAERVYEWCASESVGECSCTVKYHKKIMSN